MSDGILSARAATAPGDPIFGIFDAFRADPRPERLNLATGVYMDESGNTPILPSVHEAEARLLAGGTTKAYVPIAGEAPYLDAIRSLVFRRPGDAWGATHPVVAEGRVDLLHTPGGTGAVRLAIDLLSRLRPQAEVWVGEPTWPNHLQIVEAARLPLRRHSWLAADGRSLDLDALLGAIDGARPGDAMILHVTCHNPTGIDPTAAQWRTIAERLAARGILPILDFAYQGFGEGPIDDAAPLRTLLDACEELLVASSSSKSFGLYNERVGALSVVGASAAATRVLGTHARLGVRTMWSNPPAHGGAIVATILADGQLHAQWEAELATMRERIAANRRALVAALAAAGAPGYDHLAGQRGMFSLLGLDDAQLARLRDEHAIYLVQRGRINMAGIQAAKLPRIAQAIAAVL